jgi:hypothetical protein
MYVAWRRATDASTAVRIAWLWRPVGVSRWSLVKRRDGVEDVRTRFLDVLYALIRGGNEIVLRMYFCSPIRRRIPPES